MVIIHKHKILLQYANLSAFAKEIGIRKSEINNIARSKTGIFIPNSKTYQTFKLLESKGYAERIDENSQQALKC